MAYPTALEICKKDLFTDKDKLLEQYPDYVVERVLRLRDMYNWLLANPSSRDVTFVREDVARYKISTALAYRDLGIIKTLLPHLAQASKDFAKWKYNEMILSTYEMAERKKDIKTMEKCASSYAKFNGIQEDADTKLPYETIVVQPFTATNDPRVLGIEPIPNIEDKIASMIKKYKAETLDIEDVTYEEVDLELKTLMDNPDAPSNYGGE